MMSNVDFAAGKKRREVPLLANGDRLTQPEFHARYKRYPDDTKFELIGGVVYMASPASWLHGRYWSDLGFLLKMYSQGTPGVEVASEATAILSEESEPQPDLAMRLVEVCGGQSRINPGGYLEGPPEFLSEVAYSSRAIDLNQKRADYEQAGVLEYLVLSIEDERLFWFHFPSGQEITADRKGILRSIVLPGLWLHEKALISQDSTQSQEVMMRGIASKVHRAFVRELNRRRNEGT